MTHSPALTLARDALPCRHCGGKGCLFSAGHGWDAERNESIDYWVIGCVHCSNERHLSEAAAVEAWNRRAELAASADAGRLAEEAKRLVETFEYAVLSKVTGRGEGLEFARDNLLAALARPAPATMANGLTKAETSATASVAGLTTAEPATMTDALAAGDGTLHGAVTYRQERALKAEARAVSAQGDERITAATVSLAAGCKALPIMLAIKASGEGEVTLNQSLNRDQLMQAIAFVAQGDEVDARWQPIETAPRDGTRVLLFGHLNGEINGRLTEEPVQGVGAFFCELFFSPDPDGYSIHWDAPTHWRPLPAPPAARGQQGGQP